MIHWPNPIGGASRRASWLNRLLEAARSRVLKGVTGGKLIPHTDGQWLVIDPSGTGGGDGWNFANPLVYNSKTQYSRNKVVFVGPENKAVTTGVAQPDDTTEFATPGLWVCYNPPRETDVGGAVFIFVPKWNSPSEAGIKDVHWIPIWTNICG